MPGPLPMDEVIRKTLRGIARAQKDYSSWAGGDWLWNAPEYMLTTYIAREIASAPNRGHSVTLENNARQAIRDAGGIGKGRTSAKLRLDGRFDVVLWQANGYPRAVIEVKNQVRSFKKVAHDAYRICGALRKHSNKFQCGLVAFYTSCREESESDARTHMRRILTRFEHDAEKYLNAHRPGFTSSMHYSRIRVDGDSAWTAAALKIERA